MGLWAEEKEEGSIEIAAGIWRDVIEEFHLKMKKKN